MSRTPHGPQPFKWFHSAGRIPTDFSYDHCSITNIFFSIPIFPSAADRRKFSRDRRANNTLEPWVTPVTHRPSPSRVFEFFVSPSNVRCEQYNNTKRYRFVRTLFALSYIQEKKKKKIKRDLYHIIKRFKREWERDSRSNLGRDRFQVGFPVRDRSDICVLKLPKMLFRRQ